MEDETPESIVAAVQAHGWRQGHVLPAAAHAGIEAAIGSKLDPQDVCIVITHSCDLARPDPTLDVEIVLAVPTGGKLDGGRTQGRSRKKLHIEIAVSGSRQAIEIAAQGRHDVPLVILAQHAPDPERSLHEQDREILIAWLVARYARPGFPNAFEHRLAKQRKALERAADKLSWIWRIYVGLSEWHDLPDGKSYKAQVFCVMRAEDFRDIAKRQEAMDAVGRFLAALSQCPGIEVSADAQESLVTDDDFTLYEERHLRRWQRFDFMSFGDTAHVRDSWA